MLVATVLLLVAGSGPSAVERETAGDARRLTSRHAGGAGRTSPVLVAGESRPGESGVRVGPQRGVDPELARMARESVFVFMDPTLARESSERRGVRKFARECGASVRFEYETVLPDVVNVRDISEVDVEALRLLPGVVRVEPDEIVRIQLNDSTPLVRASEAQLEAAGLSTTGDGVRVCVIDSGIDSDHTLYAERIDTAAGIDVFNADSDPEDDNGHGAHVAGIAVGGVGQVDFGNGPEPFQGMAPGATLIGVKATNADGAGLSSFTIAGIDHCASQSLPNGRADVINLSLGGLTGFNDFCDNDTVATAANAAVNQGLVVVAASGNEDFNNALISPACASQVISVGATYDANYNFDFEFPGLCTDFMPNVDQIACFSNESDNLDATAPGCLIFSADAFNSPNGIVSQCGTSQASPHVSGLAALIIEADPLLTPAEVRQVITAGAIDLGPAGHDRAFGFGRIDAINSLQLVGGCVTDADCDDGLFCNGVESCVDSECEAGTSPCDDGDGGTTDGCFEIFDVCAHRSDDPFCAKSDCYFFVTEIGFLRVSGSDAERARPVPRDPRREPRTKR